MYNYTNVVLHQSKPLNPKDGDVYHDITDGTISTYSNGGWFKYISYQDDKSIKKKRKDKIDKIIKSI